jgi:hypothetical protein
MALRDGDKMNFATLQKVFANGDSCIIEAQTVGGNYVAVICARTCNDEDGTILLIPFARMFEGDPFEEVVMPDEAEKVDLG